MRSLYQGVKQLQAAATLKIYCELLARVQRWQRYTRQQVVHAQLAFDEQCQQMIWHLTIGVPASLMEA